MLNKLRFYMEQDAGGGDPPSGGGGSPPAGGGKSGASPLGPIPPDPSAKAGPGAITDYGAYDPATALREASYARGLEDPMFGVGIRWPDEKRIDGSQMDDDPSTALHPNISGDIPADPNAWKSRASGNSADAGK